MTTRQERMAEISEVIDKHEGNLSEAIEGYRAFRNHALVAQFESETPGEEVDAVTATAYAVSLHSAMNQKALAVLLALAIRRLVDGTEQ